jgi:hypothetical protein
MRFWSLCRMVLCYNVRFISAEAWLALPGHLNCQITSSYSTENTCALYEMFLAIRKSKCGGHISSESLIIFDPRIYSERYVRLTPLPEGQDKTRYKVYVYGNIEARPNFCILGPLWWVHIQFSSPGSHFLLLFAIVHMYIVITVVSVCYTGSSGWKVPTSDLHFWAKWVRRGF